MSKDSKLSSSLGFAVIPLLFLPRGFRKAEVCLGPSRLLLLCQDDVDGVRWCSRSVDLLGRVSGGVLGGGVLDIPDLGGIVLLVGVGLVVPVGPAGDGDAVLLEGPLILQRPVFPLPRLVDVELLVLLQPAVVLLQGLDLHLRVMETNLLEGSAS